MQENEKGFITVVSGLPRSGTSMMMRILESGGMPLMMDGIRKADRDNPRGYYEFELVKRLDKDSSWLPGAYGKAIKIIYIFLYNLPRQHRYKILFMRRTLDEVVASQKLMLQARNEEGGSLTDQSLMESFDRQLQKLYGWMKTQENFTTLYVDYHKVLDEPDKAVIEVSRFLGLELDTEAMKRAIDPSLHRNRSNAS